MSKQNTTLVVVFSLILGSIALMYYSVGQAIEKKEQKDAAELITEEKRKQELIRRVNENRNQRLASIGRQAIVTYDKAKVYYYKGAVAYSRYSLRKGTVVKIIGVNSKKDDVLEVQFDGNKTGYVKNHLIQILEENDIRIQNGTHSGVVDNDVRLKNPMNYRTSKDRSSIPNSNTRKAKDSKNDNVSSLNFDTFIGRWEVIYDNRERGDVKSIYVFNRNGEGEFIGSYERTFFYKWSYDSQKQELRIDLSRTRNGIWIWKVQEFENNVLKMNQKSLSGRKRHIKKL